FKSGNVILCEAKGSSGSDRVSGALDASSSKPQTVQPGSSASRASGSASNRIPEIAPSTQDKGASSASGSRSSGGLQHKVIVKVTDFGLARSVDGMETTFQGEVWGTPDYMAPEQFHGQSSIASDIYALGVVIYEMFTAKLPHRSSTG